MFFFIKKLDIHRWLGLGGKPSPVRNPHGHTITRGPHGEEVHADTLSCCHCRAHFEVIKGSGRLRGFCTRCHSVTCGAPACMVCVPFERRLENVEAGRPQLTPTAPQVLVPHLPPLPKLILPAPAGASRSDRRRDEE